jgi:hypothetical protein
LRSSRAIIFVFLLSGIRTIAQDCQSVLDFDVELKNDINWDLFPEFSLPFPIVYGPNILNGDRAGPLSHGFSHLGDVNYIGTVPKSQRAYIYYGTAYANANQPWEIERSPWGNDLVLYQNKWRSDFRNISRSLGDASSIDVDFFVYDIERVWRFDFEILRFKESPTVPSAFSSLSNAEFLKSYKLGTRDLYTGAVTAFNEGGKMPGNKQSSYSDTPVFNTFDNIQGKSWQDWITNPAGLNFITSDDNGQVGGSFYNQMDFMTPSAYYYYDYPHPFAGEYLSYLLFQIEANKAWTDKPVIPFVWMRYSFNQEVLDQPIKPWMAEATAIFPFFSGADGLWLWENPGLGSANIGVYEFFNRGLFRLSEYKRFFEGEFELVMETSARDYNESKAPIWRGVIKDNELLIAAHNPFAIDMNSETTISVAYNNWSGTVVLKGFETKLCVYDTSVLGTKKPWNFSIYPNPASEILNGSFFSEADGTAQIKLLGVKGKILASYSREVIRGLNELSLDILGIKESQFIIQISIANNVFAQKVIKIE